MSVQPPLVRLGEVAVGCATLDANARSSEGFDFRSTRVEGFVRSG